MILHLFVGDLYIERFPPALKFLKLVVKLDECREHGVASDLYLSDNIVRFNQTIHFPVGDDESTVINELEVVLYSIQLDGEESLMGFAKFVCTSGEHSITKTISLHDSRGVLVGKVPVTTFYYKSAIKLGDRVMFKPRYEPNAKEYSFLLSRRFRQPAKARPVTFNGDIEHRLDNEARDLIARDFKIVTSNKVMPPKKAAVKAPPPPLSNTAAKDSMTYNPGMTRNGAMSDAARGRVIPKPAVPKKNTKPTSTAPPKLRETHMSVGYVKNALWPEKCTGETERNLYRLQQASDMKLQILKDIALNVKMRNTRTQARQEAIKKKKLQVEVDEGKLKRVLARKENEIQLLKGTLTHLRMTNAMRTGNNRTSTPAGGSASRSRTPQGNSFSRLQHLLYPNPSDSTQRRASTPRSALSTGPRRRSSSGPRSTRSCSAGRRRSELGVSFSLGDDTHEHTVPVLYHPMSTGPSPYDSRKRPSSAPTYRATPRESKSHHHQAAQQQPPRRSLNRAELVDQLSEIFEEDFHEPYGASAEDTDRRSASPVLVVPSKTIAKDWLASARASINALHRPNHRSTSPGGALNKGSPLKSTRTSDPHSGLKSTARPGAAPRTQPNTVQIPSVTAAADTTTDDEQAEHDARHANKSAPPSFLNSLVEAHHFPGAGGYQDPDSTVSSIAVADIPFIPTAPAGTMRGARSPKAKVPKVLRETTPSKVHAKQAQYFQEAPAPAPQQAIQQDQEVPSPSYSQHSSDSLDDLSARQHTHHEQESQDQQKHQDHQQQNQHQPAAATKPSRPGSENISNLQGKIASNGVNLGPSSRVSRQLERNKKYSAAPASTTTTTTTTTSSTTTVRPHSASASSTASAQAAESAALATRAARSATADSTVLNGRGNGSSDVLDDFAKNKYSIRLGSDNSLTQATARPASTGVNRKTIAQQLEKNRKYDHSLSQAGHRISNGAIVESSRNVASRLDESIHADSDGDGQGDGESAGEADYSLSAALEQDVAQVSQSLESLQERVESMRSQRKEERVPPGWALRNPVISATHTSKTTHSTSTHSTSTGPTPTSAVLHRPQSAAQAQAQAASKSGGQAHGRVAAAAAVPTGAEDSEGEGSEYGTPDEQDIKMVFEDVSSSSGEFDLLRHREK